MESSSREERLDPVTTRETGVGDARDAAHARAQKRDELVFDTHQGPDFHADEAEAPALKRPRLSSSQGDQNDTLQLILEEMRNFSH